MSNLERMDNPKTTREWGDNTLIGDPETSGNIFYTHLELKDWDFLARALGYSEACPVVLSLLEERGEEQMAYRYARVIYWRGHLVKTLQSKTSQTGNSKYASWEDKLLGAKERNPKEPIGPLHDDDWIPLSHYSYKTGTGSPLSYALPRSMIHFIENYDGDGTTEMLGLLDNVLNQFGYKAPINLTEMSLMFISALAEKLGDSKYFLSQLIGLGKLSEDNCYRDFERVISTMKKKDISPYLANSYLELTKQELIENNIYHKVKNPRYKLDNA